MVRPSTCVPRQRVLVSCLDRGDVAKELQVVQPLRCVAERHRLEREPDVGPLGGEPVERLAIDM